MWAEDPSCKCQGFQGVCLASVKGLCLLGPGISWISTGPDCCFASLLAVALYSGCFLCASSPPGCFPLFSFIVVSFSPFTPRPSACRLRFFPVSTPFSARFTPPLYPYWQLASFTLTGNLHPSTLTSFFLLPLRPPFPLPLLLLLFHFFFHLPTRLCPGGGSQLCVQSRTCVAAG